MVSLILSNNMILSMLFKVEIGNTKWTDVHFGGNLLLFTSNI